MYLYVVLPFFFTFAATNSNPIHIDEITPHIVPLSDFGEARLLSRPVPESPSHVVSGGASIDVLFTPEITSVNADDENKRNTEVSEEVEAQSHNDAEKNPLPVEEFADEIFDPDQGIPPEFYEKILKFKSIAEFINGTNINVGFSPTGALGVPEAVPSEGCLPKKVCVDLRPEHRHPSEDVFPISVDVERCGGCCGHPELQCLPWSTEAFTVKLLKYRYESDNSLTSLGHEAKTVIRDLKCKCVLVQK